MTRESEPSISPSHSIRRRSPGEKPSLDTLPYDLLLNVASYLQLKDVHSIHLTCKSLHEFSKARPVYRRFATDLLRRCRALPLKGFQQLTDLTTDQLVRSVNRATRYDEAWRVREPKPISSPSASNYMDGEPPTSTSWFKIVSAPPNEEVDWLSPITSSYTLCATKKGKVVCWDVQTDRCLAEWNPGEKWELWKCRVEFDQRTVYFTMAKVLTGSYNDNRVMKFVLMKLTFSDGPTGATCHDPPPVFSHVTDFRTAGVVMNVFLLDPTSRLLSAFIWVATSNTIGLYVLLDWDKPKEYVFVDTGIECVRADALILFCRTEKHMQVTSSNWSCILFEDHIVIHCEESDAAFQHFYPLSLLQKYVKTLPRKNAVPVLSFYVKPGRTLKKRFRFPVLSRRPPPPSMEPTILLGGGANDGGIPVNGSGGASTVPIGGGGVPVNLTQIINGTTGNPTSTSSGLHHNPNPFPVPPWYPESAHFVRQWWPTLPGVPRVSCTVVLLAAQEEDIIEFNHFYYGVSDLGPDDLIGGRGRTKFVLVQHYFRVPVSHRAWVHNKETCPRKHKARKGGQRNGASNGDGSDDGESDSDDDDDVEHEEDLFRTCGCDIGSLTEKQRALVRQDDVLMNMCSSNASSAPGYLYGGEEQDEYEDEDHDNGEDGEDGEDGEEGEHGSEEDFGDQDDPDAGGERPRPLVAVDFGHAVWIEHYDAKPQRQRARTRKRSRRTYNMDAMDEDGGDTEVEEEVTKKNANLRLRFVTFPKFRDECEYVGSGGDEDEVREEGTSLNGSSSSAEGDATTSDGATAGSGKGKKRQESEGTPRVKKSKVEAEGVVRTLKVPDELNLGSVETINIDQSQGAVILSDRERKIWILCYE
ncbi:hypothetical protein H1R20_g122, partial [Candolleomyces eurysporus]